MDNELPFLVRHRDGREYELADVDYFVEQYKPEGFKIVDPAPANYRVPELPKVKAKAEPEPVKPEKVDA